MKRGKNHKIGTKLIWAFLAVAVLCGVVGVFGIFNITDISQTGLQLYSKNTVAITYINNLTSSYQQLRYNALILTIVSDVTKQQTCLDNIETYTAQVIDCIDKYKQGIADKEEENLFSSFLTYWDQYNQNIVDATQYFKNGQTTQASSLIITVASTKGDKMLETLNELIQYNDTQAKLQNELNSDATANATLIMIVIISVSFIAAVILGLLISRSISKPVKQLSSAADKLSVGDTDIGLHIKSRDEVGRLGQAFDNMKGAIGSLIEDANMLAEASLEGRLNVRADESKHQGDYKRIIEGFNKTLDAVTAPIEEASDVLAQVSKGDLNSTVSGEFYGDHAKMKTSINETVRALKMYINEISEVLGKMAQGDLTSEITSDFAGDFTSLKESINHIIRSLSGTLLEINTAAEQVASGTRQISDGSQTISQGSTEQASALEQLSASVTQIADQTKQNAQNAIQANTISIEAKKAAEDSDSQMINMQSAMTAINESSGNIAKIIKVIDDIAFQTNILALNAAIEAARAGVHGKGFAVVAEEVRNLAGRSSDAAKETAELIEGSLRNMEAGTKIADNTAASLKAILENIDKIVELASGIATASSEQATAISQVNVGIEQLSAVVQTNSATTQQAAASSEELSSQAEMLKQMISHFVLSTSENEKLLPEESGHYKANPSDEHQSISLMDEEFGKY